MKFPGALGEVLSRCGVTKGCRPADRIHQRRRRERRTPWAWKKLAAPPVYCSCCTYTFRYIRSIDSTSNLTRPVRIPATPITSSGRELAVTATYRMGGPMTGSPAARVTRGRRPTSPARPCSTRLVGLGEAPLGVERDFREASRYVTCSAGRSADERGRDT
jgi:hypothetical protein